MFKRKVYRKFELDVEKSKLKPILSDVVLFGEYHPLIRKVHPVDDGSGFFKIIEQPFSFVPIPIKYFAKTKINGDHIHYEIKGVPLHQVKIDYNLKEDENKTLVEFDLEIKSFSMTKKLLASKMLDAQEEIMKKIQDQYQNPT